MQIVFPLRSMGNRPSTSHTEPVEGEEDSSMFRILSKKDISDLTPLQVAIKKNNLK